MRKANNPNQKEATRRLKNLGYTYKINKYSMDIRVFGSGLVKGTVFMSSTAFKVMEEEGYELIGVRAEIEGGVPVVSAFFLSIREVQR